MNSLPDEPRGKLLRLAIVCPQCGSRPAMRITETLKQAVLNETPTKALATYQCQRRGCGYVYEVPARAYQAGE